ncbi:hypothetical protein KPL74_08760 [Bacillus sp. NP157]|nr:hypothetical protein KPL74_08760 [Bacillus sp. NP157]
MMPFNGRMMVFEAIPLLLLCFLVGVVLREGGRQVMRDRVFQKRVRTAARWARVHPLLVPAPFVLSVMADVLLNPRPRFAYATPAQWCAATACVIVGPACLIAYTCLMPKLLRGKRVIALERVDASTAGLHVRRAGGRLSAYRQVDPEPLRSARVALGVLVEHGTALVEAGWKRVELVSPEIGAGTLSVRRVDAFLRARLPDWHVVTWVERPFPLWKALVYWAAKRPHRWVQVERGVVLAHAVIPAAPDDPTRVIHERGVWSH